MPRKIKHYISYEDLVRYAQIVDEIRTEHMITIDEAAADSGLSPATMSRIMKPDPAHSITRATIRLIRAFITKYRKDFNA